VGFRHFLAPLEFENTSGQGKEVNDLKTAEALVNTGFMQIRAESTSLSGFEAIFASVFVLSPISTAYQVGDEPV